MTSPVVRMGGFSSLCIFHRKLGSDDESADLMEKSERLLYYYPNETKLEIQVKNMSFYEGMIDFARLFNPAGPVDSIEMDRRRMIFLEPEPDVWIVLVLVKETLVRQTGYPAATDSVNVIPQPVGSTLPPAAGPVSSIARSLFTTPPVYSGPPLSTPTNELYSSDSISDDTFKGILLRVYDVIRLFYGGLNRLLYDPNIASYIVWQREQRARIRKLREKVDLIKAIEEQAQQHEQELGIAGGISPPDTPFSLHTSTESANPQSSVSEHCVDASDRINDAHVSRATVLADNVALSGAGDATAQPQSKRRDSSSSESAYGTALPPPTSLISPLTLLTGELLLHRCLLAAVLPYSPIQAIRRYLRETMDFLLANTDWSQSTPADGLSAIRYVCPPKRVRLLLASAAQNIIAQVPAVAEVCVLYDGYVVWGRQFPGLRCLYSFLRILSFASLVKSVEGSYLAKFHPFAFGYTPIPRSLSSPVSQYQARKAYIYWLLESMSQSLQPSEPLPPPAAPTPKYLYPRPHPKSTAASITASPLRNKAGSPLPLGGTYFHTGQHHPMALQQRLQQLSVGTKDPGMHVDRDNSSARVDGSRQSSSQFRSPQTRAPNSFRRPISSVSHSSESGVPAGKTTTPLEAGAASSSLPYCYWDSPICIDSIILDAFSLVSSTFHSETGREILKHLTSGEHKLREVLSPVLKLASAMVLNPFFHEDTAIHTSATNSAHSSPLLSPSQSHTPAAALSRSESMYSAPRTPEFPPSLSPYLPVSAASPSRYLTKTHASAVPSPGNYPLVRGYSARSIRSDASKHHTPIKSSKVRGSGFVSRDQHDPISSEASTLMSPIQAQLPNLGSSAQLKPSDLAVPAMPSLAYKYHSLQQFVSLPANLPVLKLPPLSSSYVASLGYLLSNYLHVDTIPGSFDGTNYFAAYGNLRPSTPEISSTPLILHTSSGALGAPKDIDGPPFRNRSLSSTWHEVQPKTLSYPTTDMENPLVLATSTSSTHPAGDKASNAKRSPPLLQLDAEDVSHTKSKTSDVSTSNCVASESASIPYYPPIVPRLQNLGDSDGHISCLAGSLSPQSFSSDLHLDEDCDSLFFARIPSFPSGETILSNSNPHVYHDGNAFTRSIQSLALEQPRLFFPPLFLSPPTTLPTISTSSASAGTLSNASTAHDPHSVSPPGDNSAVVSGTGTKQSAEHRQVDISQSLPSIPNTEPLSYSSYDSMLPSHRLAWVQQGLISFLLLVDSKLLASQSGKPSSSETSVTTSSNGTGVDDSSGQGNVDPSNSSGPAGDSVSFAYVQQVNSTGCTALGTKKSYATKNDDISIRMKPARSNVPSATFDPLNPSLYSTNEDAVDTEQGTASTRLSTVRRPLSSKSNDVKVSPLPWPPMDNPTGSLTEGDEVLSVVDPSDIEKLASGSGIPPITPMGTPKDVNLQIIIDAQTHGTDSALNTYSSPRNKNPHSPENAANDTSVKYLSPLSAAVIPKDNPSMRQSDTATKTTEKNSVSIQLFSGALTVNEAVNDIEVEASPHDLVASAVQPIFSVQPDVSSSVLHDLADQLTTLCKPYAVVLGDTVQDWFYALDSSLLDPKVDTTDPSFIWSSAGRSAGCMEVLNLPNCTKIPGPVRSNTGALLTQAAAVSSRHALQTFCHHLRTQWSLLAETVGIAAGYVPHQALGSESSCASEDPDTLSLVQVPPIQKSTISTVRLPSSFRRVQFHADNEPSTSPLLHPQSLSIHPKRIPKGSSKQWVMTLLLQANGCFVHPLRGKKVDQHTKESTFYSQLLSPSVENAFEPNLSSNIGSVDGTKENLTSKCAAEPSVKKKTKVCTPDVYAMTSLPGIISIRGFHVHLYPNREEYLLLTRYDGGITCIRSGGDTLWSVYGGNKGGPGGGPLDGHIPDHVAGAIIQTRELELNFITVNKTIMGKELVARRK